MLAMPLLSCNKPSKNSFFLAVVGELASVLFLWKTSKFSSTGWYIFKKHQRFNTTKSRLKELVRHLHGDRAKVATRSLLRRRNRPLLKQAWEFLMVSPCEKYAQSNWIISPRVENKDLKPPSSGVLNHVFFLYLKRIFAGFKVALAGSLHPSAAPLSLIKSNPFLDEPWHRLYKKLRRPLSLQLDWIQAHNSGQVGPQHTIHQILFASKDFFDHGKRNPKIFLLSLTS